MFLFTLLGSTYITKSSIAYHLSPYPNVTLLHDLQTRSYILRHPKSSFKESFISYHQMQIHTHNNVQLPPRKLRDSHFPFQLAELRSLIYQSCKDIFNERMLYFERWRRFGDIRTIFFDIKVPR